MELSERQRTASRGMGNFHVRYAQETVSNPEGTVVLISEVILVSLYSSIREMVQKNILA